MVLVERLNEAYAARALAERGREPFRIRPSNLGGCLRELAFRLNGLEPEPLRPEQVRTFENGTQRGEALEEIAKSIWPDAMTQVGVRIPCGKHDLDGTADLYIPSLMTLVDFKTQATFGFGLLDTEGVSFEYEMQAHAYRHGIALRGFGPPVRDIRAFIVYEAKDSDGRKGIKAQELKEMEVPFTDELEARYQKRMQEIEMLLDLKARECLMPEIVRGVMDEKGKSYWKCREENGKPLYCSVGPKRGGCK